MGKINRKGFTLIEVLGCIFLLSLLFVLGYMSYAKILDSSDKAIKDINYDSVMRAAGLYAMEYDDQLQWQEETNESITCFSIDSIIGKGFLDDTEVTDYYKTNYRIKVTKSSDEINDYKLVEKSTCSVVDKTSPIVRIVANNSSSNYKWSNSTITLKGEAYDSGSGIRAYQFSNSATPTNTWTVLDYPKDSVSVTRDISNDGVETIYFHAKDDGGNVSSKGVEVYIDSVAPKYVRNTGDFTPNSIPTATFEDDDSGIDTTKYMISNLPTAPEPDNDSFETNPVVSLSCNKSYYVWAVATDKAGNYSPVVKLKSYYASCHVPESDDDDDDDDNNNNPGGNSGGRGDRDRHSSGGGGGGGSGGGSSCSATCQMQKNSEAWHDTNDPAEKERLHQENVRLAESIGLNEGNNFNSSTGVWSGSDGKQLYTVSGGSGKNSSGSSNSHSGSSGGKSSSGSGGSSGGGSSSSGGGGGGCP